MKRTVQVMLLLAVALTLGVPTVARAEQGQAGACADNAGVTVIVDFQELAPSAGPTTRCAPQAGGHGLEILTKAGVSYDTFGGNFVCRIGGRPESDPCTATSPPDAYWSYWLAPRGGAWCYSSKGASYRDPPAGTVEGWSFAKNRQDSGAVPPRSSPPPVVAGSPPAALAKGDCDSTIQTGATTTTSSVRAARPGPTPSTTSGRATAGPSVPAATPASPASTEVAAVTTTTSASPVTTTPDTQPPGEVAGGPPVTLDVSPKHRGGGAGPAIGAAAAVTALGATAAVVARRRRRPDSDAADESLL